MQFWKLSQWPSKERNQPPANSERIKKPSLIVRKLYDIF